MLVNLIFIRLKVAVSLCDHVRSLCAVTALSFSSLLCQLHKLHISDVNTIIYFVVRRK
jgi:hypothetical protein